MSFNARHWLRYWHDFWLVKPFRLDIVGLFKCSWAPSFHCLELKGSSKRMGHTTLDNIALWTVLHGFHWFNDWRWYSRCKQEGLILVKDFLLLWLTMLTWQTNRLVALLRNKLSPLIATLRHLFHTARSGSNARRVGEESQTDPRSTCETWRQATTPELGSSHETGRWEICFCFTWRLVASLSAKCCKFSFLALLRSFPGIVCKRDRPTPTPRPGHALEWEFIGLPWWRHADRPHLLTRPLDPVSNLDHFCFVSVCLHLNWGAGFIETPKSHRELSVVQRHTRL